MKNLIVAAVMLCVATPCWAQQEGILSRLDKVESRLTTIEAKLDKITDALTKLAAQPAPVAPPTFVPAPVAQPVYPQGTVIYGDSAPQVRMGLFGRISARRAARGSGGCGAGGCQ